MKKKFVCAITALCLALSVAGCGKSSEEQQAVNYYQNELGLDREEAEELAHEIYGEDEEEPGVTEETPEETVVEPLPELVNSEWYDRKVQILDMVFTNDWHMTEEYIRKTVEGSAYDVEIVEGFDENGNIQITDLTVNGNSITFPYEHPFFDTTLKPSRATATGIAYSNLKAYGWFNDESSSDELCYHIRDGIESNTTYYCCDKQSIEYEDLNFETRDDVLAYLSENGFVEVQKEQACYSELSLWDFNPFLISDEISVEYVDTPHYYCEGVKSITLYRMHKLDETDQDVERLFIHYSGASLYLLNTVRFYFNTDGTIDNFYSEWPYEVMVAGEKIH